MLPPACGREGRWGQGVFPESRGSTQATREEGAGQEVPRKQWVGVWQTRQHP